MSSARIASSALAALLLAGCSSFEATAVRRFVDEANNYVSVEEARDDRDHFFDVALPDGKVVRDKTRSKVRVTLPDGSRFVAYQRLSPFGNLFRTDDEKWEYLVQGMACCVARMAPDGGGYSIMFQGTLCATESGPRQGRHDKGAPPRRSSAPSGFKSPSSERSQPR